MTRIKERKAWGGFSDGKLDEFRPGQFAIFRTKVEAQRRYLDVRRVEITWDV